MSKERAWSVLALVQVGLLAQYSAPTVVAVALVDDRDDGDYGEDQDDGDDKDI